MPLLLEAVRGKLKLYTFENGSNKQTIKNEWSGRNQKRQQRIQKSISIKFIAVLKLPETKK